MASRAIDSGGLAPFLRAALAPLLERRLLAPILMLALLLTSSNIVILLSAPAPGHAPPAPFVAAAVVRVFGLFYMAVGILRRLSHSPRPAWRPDGALWLFVLVSLFQLGTSVAAGVAAGVFAGRDPVAELVLEALVTLLLLPLAAWFAAIAVERPLAWRPGRWLSAFPAWLPHLILGTVLVTFPLAGLHAAIGRYLVAGAGSWFWPLALVDGALSVLLVLSGLALASEAYRRVARG